MPVQSATTAIFADTYHLRSDGTCAVSIRITHERKKKYYHTKYALTPADFKKVMGKSPRDPFKGIRLDLEELEIKAAKVIERLPVFTWSAFEKGYLKNKAAKDTLEAAFQDYADQMKTEQRISTASSYECSMNSFKKFSPDARFVDVTPEFLRSYESWMLKEENSITTVGIYTRALRAIFNNAIAEGLLTRDLYPFGKRRYEIPTGKNIKKALKIDDISKIFHHQLPKDSNAEMCRDYWLFMYMANGINVKDMCLLKFSNIDGDVISFIRAKTARTKRLVEPIRVMLNDHLKNIIARWGNAPDPKSYIFPVLAEGQDAVRQRQLIQQLTHLINDHMKVIATDLKIDRQVTTYYARHSFATILKQSGASELFIGEAIGHASERSTRNYLGGFEDEAKKETLKALIAFK